MFARVLYLDDQRALEVDWFGLGAVLVRQRDGTVRRGIKFQKQMLMSLLQHFEALGQPVTPANPRCSRLLMSFAVAMEDTAVPSLRWQALLRAGPAEAAAYFAEADT